MKIMFSAGEASGDIHASRVARELKALYPDVSMFGMGGDLMADAGVDIIYDIKNLGYIGFVEILKALPFFFKLRSMLKEAMIKEKPDVLVCVDYPGFNMKLAKVAYELGIPVVYYIAPSIWVWHKSRGKDIAKYVKRVISIFPFEAKAYREFNVDVDFVGHPLLDIVKPELTKEETYEYFHMDQEACNILLMPGSRKQEISSLLDMMLSAAKHFLQTHPSAHFYLPRAHTISREELQAILAKHPEVGVTITEDYTYDLMQVCKACLAASGTATLETALMDLPTVLLYRVASLTYWIARLIVHVKWVGLPNIVAGREVIPELIQDAVSPDNVYKHLTAIIDDTDRYKQMKDDLLEVRKALGQSGAVRRVAQSIAEIARREDTHGKL
ncbi:MAG: lipid-A-disaccharide synthase [Veillonellaceae bacterium]|nr:lipid-A-disaccharide synthase [Veillonellaceae bacterium]